MVYFLKTISIFIIINNKVQGSYTFDRLKNKSELLVEFFRDFMLREIELSEKQKQLEDNINYKTKWKYEYLEFYLKQNGGFQFY